MNEEDDGMQISKVKVSVMNRWNGNEAKVEFFICLLSVSMAEKMSKSSGQCDADGDREMDLNGILGKFYTIFQ